MKRVNDFSDELALFLKANKPLAFEPSLYSIDFAVLPYEYAPGEFAYMAVHLGASMLRQYEILGIYKTQESATAYCDLLRKMHGQSPVKLVTEDYFHGK